jgi:competence protein ComGC
MLKLVIISVLLLLTIRMCYREKGNSANGNNKKSIRR